jgi:hypothetical protein
MEHGHHGAPFWLPIYKLSYILPYGSILDMGVTTPMVWKLWSLAKFKKIMARYLGPGC